ncbi:MAG: hypothetical protein J7559_12505, partial [Cohnella sp.]|nr:hypothetical protein [Cohnella sp.]
LVAVQATQHVAQPVLRHEQNVEVIEGLTKLCNGLSRNLKEIINPDKDDDAMSSFMSGFGASSGDKSK